MDDLLAAGVGPMAHHLGDEPGQHQVGYRGVQRPHRRGWVGLFPDTFIGVCQLPQSPGARPEGVRGRAGAVRAPSLGSWAATSTRIRAAACGPARRSPTGTGIRSFEKMVELDVPAMVHVCASATPTSTPPARTISMPTPPLSCSSSGDLFADFPDLRLVIPHGGGAVPYHWGRYRGLAAC